MLKKITFLLLIFFSFISLYSQEGQFWKWSHEKPQGNALRWVKMWNNTTWYAVGAAGTFMKTTNAGASWFFHHRAGAPEVDGTNALYAGYFRNMDSGFVIGTDGVMVTTNGGTTFSPIAVQLPVNATWYNVYMLNNNVGYIAGTTSGRLAKTTDGGYSWTVNTLIASGTFYDAWSPDENLILVSTTAGNIRRSTDGGASFAVVSTGTSATLYKFAFRDATTGFVVGSTGACRMTTDAGATWTSINTGLPTATTFYDVDLVGNNIYLTGDLYNTYHSSDNGTTWTPISHLAPVSQQPWTSNYYGADFLSDRFVVVGNYGIINSKIGTSTAVLHTEFRKPGLLYDIWANSPNGKVIAVGAPGNSTSHDQVLYSTNGGINWNKGTFTSLEVTQPTEVQAVIDEQYDYNSEAYTGAGSELLTPTSLSTYRSIDMIDSLTGYIVGSLGAVYRTSNGGTGWDSVVTPIPSSVTLYDVDFVDANNGWVVGSSGNVWRTSDGGANWTQQTSTFTTGIVYSVSMASNSTGWISGAGGVVNYTTDGGTTWAAQTSGFGTSVIYGIKAINSMTAYCCGASSKFGKSTDGGVTWTLLANFPASWGTATTLYALDFRDANYGVVSGASARIGVTTDGGLTWSVETTGGSIGYGVRIANTGTTTTAAFVTGTNSYVHKNANFTVPVELTALTANVSGTQVILRWSTASETNNRGFGVERRTENTSFEEISFVNGNGTTTEAKSYSYTDNVINGKYIYRLRQVDFDGTVSFSKEVEADATAPVEFALSQNYPNPFNPVTVIKYAVPVDGFVTLSVYNLLGEKVAQLVNGEVKSGTYEVSFDASDLSSGVYMYKLESGSFTSTKKLVLMK